MFFLLYASSAPRKFSVAELDHLLSLSRRNNRRVGILGMLLYADGNFIQYIEGLEDHVRTLYARIGEDTRHRNLMVLAEGETAGRLFSDWSMGWKQLTREETATLGRFDLNRVSIEARLAGADDRLIVTMMKQFCAAAYPQSD